MISQTDLFHFDRKLPERQIPGLAYIADYISAQEEQILLAEIDRQKWLPDLKRRVQHYGYKYDYKVRSLSRDMYLGPLPEWLDVFSRRLYQDKIFSAIPDQVIVNEYVPGQGISAHIDCVPCFSGVVSSLSLGSFCAMEFSNSRTDRKREILLAPCSLVTLSGPARYEWLHAIPPRRSDVINSAKVARQRRVSLTFRQVILANRG